MDTDELDWLEELAAKAKPSLFGRYSRANYAFIRFCSPEFISSLVRRVREAEADVEETKDFRDGYKEIAERERARAVTAEQMVKDLKSAIRQRNGSLGMASERLAKGELIIPLADLVGPEGGTLMQVTKLYEQARAEAERFEADRDKWQNRQTQCEEWWRAAEAREKALRDRVAPTIQKIEQQLQQPSSEFWLTLSADEGRELVNALRTQAADPTKQFTSGGNPMCNFCGTAHFPWPTCPEENKS